MALAALTLSGCSVSSTPAEPVAPPITVAELSAQDVGAWLDGMLPAMLEREGVVGASVAVVGDGEVLAERGYGYAQVGGPDGPALVDADSTLFRIGSISKLFTATVVMQLVERGELDLDAPISRVLDFDLPTRFAEPITMRHLLTHTAGFEDEIAGLITAPGTEPTSLREALASDPPAQIFPPGTTPAYSNYSNGLAGYVAERVSGLPFEELVQTRVFDVAGMATATLDQPLPEAAQATMSTGYRAAGSPTVPFEVVTPAPAGAISATAADMSSFMLSQLGASSAPVLKAGTLELMHEPGLEEETLHGLASGPRMTLGFFERDRNGHRILSHAGDLTAFHAQLELYPEDAAGIYISLNSTGLNADSSTHIREALTTGFADRYFPDERPSAAPTATAAEHAAQVAGTYQLSRRSETTFLRAFFIASSVEVSAGDDGVVTVSAIIDATGRPVPFVETAPWLWTEVGGGRVLAVDQDAGVVTAIGLDPAFILQPMPTARAVMPTIAAISIAVLALVLVLVPASALGRRVRRNRASTTPAWRTTEWLTWAAAASLTASLLPWSTVANALLTDGPAPSESVIRGGQALMAIAALGVVPAVWRVVLALRESRRGSLQILTAAVVAAAFMGLTYTLWVGGMLQPSITY